MPCYDVFPLAFYDLCDTVGKRLPLNALARVNGFPVCRLGNFKFLFYLSKAAGPRGIVGNAFIRLVLPSVGWLCIFCAVTATGQTMPRVLTSLQGFSLGQYRETAVNYLKAPADKGRFADGFGYEVFDLRTESGAPLRLTVGFTAEEPEQIWSLCLTGRAGQLPIKGLSLGADSALTLSLAGKPSTISNLPDAGKTRWEYDDANYTLTMDGGVLSAFQITDEPGKWHFNAPAFGLQVLGPLVQDFSGNKRAAMALRLAPDIEVLDSSSAYSFEQPLNEEIRSDYSGIFSMLSDPEYGLPALKKVHPADMEVLERAGNDAEHPMQAIFLNGNYPIRELIFRHSYGRWLLWEVRLNNFAHTID